MRQFLLLTLFLSTLASVSLNDTLNKYNDKGKKHGYWIIYLDKSINETDRSNSYYFGLQLYDNGQKLFSFIKLKEIKLKVVSDNESSEKGHPVILNGDFKWYRHDSELVYHHRYENGRPVFYKRYQRNNKKNDSLFLCEFADFNNRYNGVLGTYTDTLYSAYSDTTIELCYRKGKRKWKWFTIH